MVWNEETIRHLRDLWEQGHSTAEIGRRLGVSKNAIVGKAHRLELTARPSPIRRDGRDRASERPQPSFRPAGPTLPPLPSAAAHSGLATTFAPQIRVIPARAPAPVQAPAASVRPVAQRAPVAPPVRVVPPPAPGVHHRRSAPACCWPIGEPGKKDFHFCDDVSVPGKPYCDAHARLAYVKIRDRKDDAA